MGCLDVNVCVCVYGKDKNSSEHGIKREENDCFSQLGKGSRNKRLRAYHKKGSPFYRAKVRAPPIACTHGYGPKNVNSPVLSLPQKQVSVIPGESCTTASVKRLFCFVVCCISCFILFFFFSRSFFVSSFRLFAFSFGSSPVREGRQGEVGK